MQKYYTYRAQYKKWTAFKSKNIPSCLRVKDNVTLFAAKVLDSADGELTVYLGTSAFPPLSSQPRLTYCGRISVTVPVAKLEKIVECVVPMNTEFVYIEGKGAASVSLCEVQALMAGKQAQYIYQVWRQMRPQSTLLVFFNSLFKLTAKKIFKFRITGPLWREFTVPWQLHIGDQ